MPIKGKILSTFPIEISVAAIGKNKNVFWSVCPSILIYRPLLFISGLFCSVSFCLFTFCFLVFGFFRHFRYWLLETVVRDKTSLFMDKWPQPIFGIGCSTFLIVCSRRGGSSATANDWEERKKEKNQSEGGLLYCLFTLAWSVITRATALRTHSLRFNCAHATWGRADSPGFDGNAA